MCEVVSKNIALKNNIVFPKKTILSQKTHCFPTCALFYPIVLKRKIITGYAPTLHQTSYTVTMTKAALMTLSNIVSH